MRFVRTALAVVVLASCAFARGVSHLEGTIRDASGAVVPHAAILCVEETTGFRFTAESGPEGSYELAVPEGSYNMVVRYPGFRLVARIGVLVPEERSARADFEIAPEDRTESLTVLSNSGETTQIAEPPIGVYVLNPEEVRALPRNDGAVNGLLALAPGVLFTPASRGEAGQFSSAGARPNSNRFSVDGVNANNAVAGAGWPSFLPGDRLPAMTALGTTQTLAVFDSIREMTVKSQDDAASLETDPGAHVAIETKQGENEFHGSLSYAGRPPALGASDWFANRYGLAPDAPSLHSETASLGGPLQHDRTFFFVAAERTNLSQGYAWTTTVPSQLARQFAGNLQPLLNEFPLPNGPDLTFGISEYIGQNRTPSALTAVNARIDRILASGARLFLRVADTPSWSELGLTQINSTHYRGRVAALGSTWTTGAWLHESRLSFSRNDANSMWSSAGGSQPALPAFYSQYPSLAADFSNISVGGAGSVSLGESGHNLENQWQVSQTSGLRLSRHEATFGIGYVDLQPARDGGNSSVTVAFGSPTNPVLGPPAPVWITESRPEANSLHLRRLSAFARDAWKLNTRLTLTFGLGAAWVEAPRLNPASDLYFVDDSLSLFTLVRPGELLWHTNPLRLTPTIGAAAGIGRAVLRGSFAVFQDSGSSAATDQLNGIPYQQMRSATGAALDFSYDPSTLSEVPLGHGYANNLALPRYLRWNVRLEAPIGPAGFVQLGYVGMTGSRELRKEILLNPSTPAPLGALTFRSSDGASQYHALNAVFRRALTRGLHANVSYVWSHSIDLGSADSSVFLAAPAQSASGDRGSSDFDVRHSLNASLSYSPRSFKSLGFLNRVASGWTFGTVVSARSGFPVDVLISETLDGFAIENYRAGLFPGAQPWVSDPKLPAGRGLNPDAFGFPLQNLAPLGRNAIRGFGMWQADVSTERAFVLGRTWRLALRGEAYNLFNHPLFGDPVRYASNPMFGQSQTPLNLMFGGGSPSSGESPALVTGGPRALQVSVRLSF